MQTLSLFTDDADKSWRKWNAANISFYTVIILLTTVIVSLMFCWTSSTVHVTYTITVSKCFIYMYREQCKSKLNVYGKHGEFILFYVYLYACIGHTYMYRRFKHRCAWIKHCWSIEPCEGHLRVPYVRVARPCSTVPLPCILYPIKIHLAFFGTI